VTGTASPGAILVLQPKAPADAAPTLADGTPSPPDASQSEPPVMDQVSATFTPEMLFVRTGQPVEFRNSDDTLHNVHVGNTETREGSFNVAIPTGEVYKYTFAKDGFYHVGCDIHPAMSAEIIAVSTPFATLAAADGTFGFSNVPSGAYLLKVLAAGVKTERNVDIVSGPNVITSDGRGDR
jgi:plastocyanin